MSEENLFIARDGQEIGPFTQSELLRAIAAGRYGKGDLIWQDSANDWLPLERVPPYSRQIGREELIDPKADPKPQPKPKATPPSPPPQPEVLQRPPVQVFPPGAGPAQSGELLRPGDRADLSQRRPFVRYAARMLDMAIFSFPLLAIASVFGVHLRPDHTVMLELFLLALYVPVEALLMASFGTTPGKVFMRLRVVREDGQPLTLSTTLNRAVMVWWRGWGIGVPLVSFVVRIIAFGKLVSEGKTTWDRDLQLRVIHQPVGVVRALIAIFLLLFLFGASMGTLTEQALRHS